VAAEVKRPSPPPPREEPTSSDRTIALLRAALESIPDGILVLDVRGAIVASNDQLAQMWGMPKEILVPGPSEAVLRFLLEKVADPAAFLSSLNRPSTGWERDGHEEIVLENGKILERYARPHVVDGEIVGLVVTCRDVTAARAADARYRELLELETAARGAAQEAQCRVQILADDLRESLDDLRRTQDELVRSERMGALGELASTIAHEVRNSLGSIFNALAGLRRRVSNEGDVGVLLDVVQAEADRLNRIVLDLLVFARPTPGEPSYVAVLPLMEEALQAALRKVEFADSIRVERSFPDDLPAVYATGSLTSIALTNVISNALQAMPAGGALHMEATTRVLDDRSFVVLTFADNGPGIAADVLPRIFEPFFTTKALGTGLGLSIAKRLLEEQRGSIEVTSEPGEGTTFVVWLPC
jgi:PAS domain S-box-containing protein